MPNETVTLEDVLEQLKALLDEREAKPGLTVAEAAKRYGICVSRMYELSNQKGFPAVRVGEKRIVIPRKALDEWFYRQAIGADHE